MNDLITELDSDLATIETQLEMPGLSNPEKQALYDQKGELNNLRLGLVIRQELNGLMSEPVKATAQHQTNYRNHPGADLVGKLSECSLADLLNKPMLCTN